MKSWLELKEVATKMGPSVPKPGGGSTQVRFGILADWAACDLSLARLAEGHIDALAILAEAGIPPEPEATYGVWAARSGSCRTTARLDADGWHLAGRKPFCSGSTHIDRALVTAECDDGYRLFDVSVGESVMGVDTESWPAVGMADSVSVTLEFGGPPIPRSRAVGPSDFYLERPGFWFGATGVAACWYGGARGVVEHLVREVGAQTSEVVLVELGHAVAHVDTMRRLIEQAAGEIDDDPVDRAGQARRRALVVRHAVHHGAQEVLIHAAAAGGARSFCLDAEQSQRVADLYIYLTQYHGPQDANVLGGMARDGWSWN